jgi:hypothetical protein
MANNTINAAANPALANELAKQAFAEPEEQIEKAQITPPSDTLVTLPGGYVSPSGEVIRVAEVRELNGKDEEALGKVPMTRAFTTILNRAVVSIGTERATESMLDNLLAGDRDALLLGIYRATFGPTADIPSFCQGCKDFKTVTLDISGDIKTKMLVDPIGDRNFSVQGKNKSFLVTLPTGVTQRELLAAEEKNSAELTTILLNNTVVEIDGQSVYSPVQVQALGLVDRRKIVEEISLRSPGPKFESVTVECPDCGGEVVVPVTLGALFRL